MVDWLYETWRLIELSGPWLLFGFGAAGLIKVFLPERAIEHLLKKPGPKSVAAASVIGIPLPLCSCSVIPVAVSLRRKGANKGATASFMVSTPEIGIDSFLLTYVLLGPFLAVIRVVAAFFTAFATGMSVLLFNSEEPATPTVDTKPPSSPAPCCSKQSKPQDKQALRARFIEAFRYGYVTVVQDLARLLLFGFLVAGLISSLVPDTFFSGNFSRTSEMLLALLISVPIYICSTSATPLAAALLLKGASPGAIIVFLLAGPATNITTILAVVKELGIRSLLAYVCAIVVSTLSIGLCVDYFFSETIRASLASSPLAHGHGSPLDPLFGFILSVLLVFGAWPRVSSSSKKTANCCDSKKSQSLKKLAQVPS